MKISVLRPWSLLSIASLGLFTGCALESTAPPSTVSGMSVQGHVHGGKQPVVGAHIFLFAANTTGYAGPNITASSTNASKPIALSGTGVAQDTDMLSPTFGDTYVTTDGTGAFTLTGDYSCTPSDQLYLFASGGNTGAGTNSSAGFLSLLGTCPAAGNFAAKVPYIWINEVTTIAAAYAMAGFATDATHVSSSGTTLAATGIANAFANFNTLVDIATGVPNSVNPNNPNGVVPRNKLNTMANILAACVNSTDADPGNCNNLFSYVKSGGESGILAQETATEAIYMAHNPGTNMDSLFGLQTGVGSPFGPHLNSAPPDFLVALTWTGNDVDEPTNIAIDAAGNAWVTNYTISGGLGALSKFKPAGAAATNSPYTSNGLNSPQRVAIDLSGDVWVPEPFGNKLSKFTATGTAATNSPFNGNGLNDPHGVAIDASGNVWTANYDGTTVSEFTSSGDAASGSPFNLSGTVSPTSVAVDASGFVWMVDSGNSKLYKINGSGTLQSNFPVSGNGMNFPLDVEIDGSGNAWVAGYASNEVGKFTSTGGVAGSSPFAVNASSDPRSVAIDGAGNVWVSNFSSSVSELSRSGTLLSPSAGYASNEFVSSEIEDDGIAIDGSGNVWCADGLGSVLIELIGAAAPVVTPKVANLVSPYGSAAVNRP